MKKSATISSINIEDESSWQNRLFLTFDIDWADDEVLEYSIELVEQADVSATWFVTHKTKLLERLKENPKFELGIHPNFNYLLDGKSNTGRNAKEVIQRCMDIVPDAKSVRSHSMAQSTGLLSIFKECGLIYDTNHFIPCHSNINLKPWKLWNELVRIPYKWEDDVHILYEAIGVPQKDPHEVALNATNKELIVVDFHPIHLFLNTESMNRYERTRPIHKKAAELTKHRYQHYGTHSRLIDILNLCKRA